MRIVRARGEEAACEPSVRLEFGGESLVGWLSLRRASGDAFRFLGKYSSPQPLAEALHCFPDGEGDASTDFRTSGEPRGGVCRTSRAPSEVIFRSRDDEAAMPTFPMGVRGAVRRSVRASTCCWWVALRYESHENVGAAPAATDKSTRTRNVWAT